MVQELEVGPRALLRCGVVAVEALSNIGPVCNWPMKKRRVSYSCKRFQFFPFSPRGLYERTFLLVVHLIVFSLYLENVPLLYASSHWDWPEALECRPFIFHSLKYR